MLNCEVSYVLIQDGVKIENTMLGKYEKAGSFYRVVFDMETDGFKSEHTYVKISSDAFKISVKGDTSYSVTVKRKTESSSVLVTSNVNMPFTAKTQKCVAKANDFIMELYAEYYLVTFGTAIKNVLKLKAEVKGEIKC